ncbi:Receptor-like protein kinase [Thalictrum thalictroides]|uniref:Receptor-like protein kinase n=1 Tax=Thalictrum thalictroides TaxID=46969 RepID=A0A7J6W081_THATH|nr:Receptor-like protein kinase [Thalictrum thalictroides]
MTAALSTLKLWQYVSVQLHPYCHPLITTSCNFLECVAGNVKVIVSIGTSVGGTLIIVAVGIIIFCRLRKKKMKNSENLEAFLRTHGALALRRYKYSDVRKMTGSFQDKLGQGGFGSVYKGKLLDGRMVAVKVLNEAKGNGNEFINEVASISRTSHVNVVALLGFCVEGPKRALIYEYVPNGSLEKFIYAENPLKADFHLGWETLYKIAIGIAHGLEYLHRGCYIRILHFDIKPHNILLDEDFNPKISDFGLAKLCFGKDSIVSMTGARGTAGYIAPELVSRNFGGISHKADVYSYGMMVLEMVGGRKNLNIRVSNLSEIYFPQWIYKRLDLKEDLGLYGVTTEEAEEIARKLILVGLWCIQMDPSDRPAMSKVLGMLEGSLQALHIPPKPFISSSAKEEGSSSMTSIS